MPATVSVIIPAYHAAAYLERTVASVLSQTLPPHEVLIVDDGSKDNTFETAARMPPPVRAVRKPNGGPASARNLGAREASGDWLAFLDADDSWLPEKLERQMNLAATGAGLVHCLYKPSLNPPDSVTFDDLWAENCIATSTVAIRRDVFLEAGGFDEDRALIGVEDYNLWLKVAARKWPILTLQENLISYTRAAGSLTQQVERFAKAELVNLDKIAAELHLDPAMVETKRGRICEQYGRELLFHLQTKAARRYLGRAMRQKFSPARLAWWAVALAPPGALEAWRRIRGASRVQ
jgi:glycosyltransferase involved in cell wall biosynthesis